MNPTNLSQYYESIGQRLPSVSERQSVATQAGIQDYRGTAAQNAQLLTYLQGNNVTPAQTNTPTQSTVGNNINLGNVNTNLTVPNIPTVPTRTFNPTQFTEQGLLDQRGNLERELFDIEGTLTNQNARRNELLQERGIDINQVNRINNELQAAQDREIEIPIEARQDLRGRGATITEFAQRTTPQLENEALNALALSRQSQALGNQIAQIDQQLNIERENNILMYQQKTQRLNQIEQLYGNILSDNQKAQIEIAKLAAEQQKDFSDQFNKEKQSWVDYFRKEGNFDAAIRVGQAGDQTAVDSIVNSVGGSSLDEKARQSIVKANDLDTSFAGIISKFDTAGFNAAVGQGLASRTPDIFGNRQTFTNDVESMLAKLRNGKILDLISQGMGVKSIDSNAELSALSASISRLGNAAITDKNGKVTGYKIKESEFKKEIENLQKVHQINTLMGVGALTSNQVANLVNMNASMVNAEYQQMLADFRAVENNQINSNSPYNQILNGFNQVGNGTNTVSSVQIPQSSRLAYVNNNPGNLRFAGQTGATQGQGGFAQFATPQAGYDALLRQINLDASRGLTLQQFINKFAPPSENNTGLYINQIAQWTGYNPNTKLSQIPVNILGQAMARKESSTLIG